MSDYAARVQAYEEGLVAEATRCCLCWEPGTVLLSWENKKKHGIYSANGLNYCPEHLAEIEPRLQRDLKRGKLKFLQRDELTAEIIALRVDYRRKKYPMLYRSTVSEVA